MHAAVHLVLVNLGVKGIAQLSGAAAELNHLLAGCDAGYREAVRTEPRFNGGDVLIGGSEFAAELIGREPLVVSRAARRVSVGNVLLQSGFLSGAALQHQVHARERLRIGRGAAVVGGIGQRMNVAVEGDAGIFIDGADDATGHDRLAGLCGKRCAGNQEGEGNECDGADRADDRGKQRGEHGHPFEAREGKFPRRADQRRDSRGQLCGSLRSIIILPLWTQIPEKPAGFHRANNLRPGVLPAGQGGTSFEPEEVSEAEKEPEITGAAMH